MTVFVTAICRRYQLCHPDDAGVAFRDRAARCWCAEWSCIRGLALEGSRDGHCLGEPSKGSWYEPKILVVTTMARITATSGTVKRNKTVRPGAETILINYVRAKGIHFFAERVASATPMEMIELERRGIDAMFLQDLSVHMHIPAARMFDIVGISKAAVARKVAANERIAGAGGQAALGLARLLATTKETIENSTAAEARDFDAARWLGQWIERPQPALGGRKPADLIGTPTGLKVVTQLIGAIDSGAYQ
ncbi:antitoxin Xre/MbcA/ParS toxin-binding domain-containing protein [Piscinibacter sakaiensis]|uniref:antitoxin Xre/MbcA/ParS toxin-binding domain-containing protein n=1 Tax=Piscinibacter sakaiensis TaxID=1547922 RepID=UPI003AAED8D8